MIKTISRTSRFKKDFKTAQKQKKDIAKFETILKLLISNQSLPDKYKDHQLINFKEFREYHITPDWLLIYKIINEELILYGHSFRAFQ